MEKEKCMNLKRFIKEENTGQRLQSLRLPRDLSLGGTKIKKQFVPNLNVTRSKDKAKEIIRHSDQKRRGKFNDNRQHKQRDANQRYIQSSGVFSEGGSADFKRATRSGDRRSNTKENEGTFMSIPVINKNSWEVNKKNEENTFDEIMRYDEESEDEKVPFQFLTWNEKDLKDVKEPIKSEIKPSIKTEPGEESIEPTFKELKLENSVFHGLPKEYQDEQNCSDDNPTLTLWGLPDSFAGKGLSEDPNCKKLHDYRLSDMLEGQIGKLVVRKSGRVEVHIGRVKYDLDTTDLETYKEDLVAIDRNERQELAATVLGEIENRFVLNPNWDSLLKATVRTVIPYNNY